MAGQAERAVPTGGQINVTGILYQMLVSLAEGLDATVSTVEGTCASTVEIQLEPFDGGDVQVDGQRRLVIQIKRRTQGGRWSVGNVVRDVLPDLIKAVHVGADDVLQFVTDNDTGCENFRRFLTWYRGSAAGEAPPVERFRYGGGSPITGEELLAAIPAAVGIEPGDPRLPALLSSLEIIRWSETDLVRRIQTPLRILVERVEDVPQKTTQLIGELVRLGAVGARARTGELLRAAQLDPRRPVHASRLAQKLRGQLVASLPLFRYDPGKDVRHPLRAPTRAVTVLRGESGLGKTWRLCATAMAMADAGYPVLLLRASADVGGLRMRIATAVWNPVYSDAAPLQSVAARLRPALGGERGVWLTVFLDDLNDQELARSIVEDQWDRLGINLVISSQPATADWLKGSPAAPEVIEVPEFTPGELAGYLEDHEVDYSSVHDDVLELLGKPILASLYCRLPHGLILREETEYELMQSFWEHAANDRPTQLRHAFDLDRLELLVGDLLEEAPVYPWPPISFARTLGFEEVERLVLRGLIEIDGQRRVAMTHDRLLNWAMARLLTIARATATCRRTIWTNCCGGRWASSPLGVRAWGGGSATC